MNSEKMKINKLNLFLIALILIGLAAAGYFGYKTYLLEKINSNLESGLSKTRTDFVSTSKKLNAVIDSLQLNLATTTAERNDFEQKYIDEHNRMDSLASNIQTIQSRVGVLEKLSQTDPELLKKYSKVYFLNENYAPTTLTKIDAKYTCDPEKDYLFYSEVWPFLQDLLTAAQNDGIDLKIDSAYRSFYTQESISARYKVVYGSGANQFSADQGYSEHQLGTTVDFSTTALCGILSGFDKTSAYSWLLDNAYKYGFILSYPKNNQYYIFEPWHWRFVSRALAEKLHQDGKNFYDLDQREIDQYLISFFD